MDKFENEKLSNVNINIHEENKNEAELENKSRQVEYINIYWDEWKIE